jgi:FkbM family methyltransferase
MNEYYYLGNSTGMARIHGTSSLICVDTRSWESLIYIQGYPVEPHEVSVMRRFLSPGSVFLDIGANFGLYSMVASEIIGSKGQVYAFEANPHTYKYLRQSAMANRLIWLPQYHWENLAVADQDGELEFAYDPEQLGGGHIRNPGDTSDNQTIVQVASVAMDSFLPPDVTPDFVKVDVEGHELSVLKGMEQTIRRSPGIRLLLEYYTNTSEVTEYGRDVVAFVRQLGLGLCVVEGGGTLRVVPDGEIPTGNIYLLATRTPESDAAQSPSAITIKPGGLHYHAVFAEGDKALLQSDGTLRYRRDDHQDVAEPSLFFGPYVNLPAGNYTLAIDADATGSADLSITTDFGHVVVLSKRVLRWGDRISFTLREPAQAFEIVLRKRDDLERLDLKRMVIERAG